ncbi:hypothetical protein RclHR1_00390025 [Rhizophagus clarus]|uniref:BTB domain-containing protein n=1 Tax=Rhizophagus clarus TaxID=94130 RepID=A0A2Z6RF59_9GLOM|nr:hypothetical protein RclHR1_00390025 [Rhizophagus clarus]GET02199.1 hypothetical protein GLOIN_2v1878292 [Rhizophagus clarus]
MTSGLIFHSVLSKDFSLILNDADDYNVIIQVGEDNNIKEFRAHSVILRARSRYFKSALSTEWITKKNDMIIFTKPNITPTVFDIVLKYIYTGELDLENHLNEDIFELLVASDELNFEELLEFIQNYLIKNHEIWLQENFDLVLHTVFDHVSFKLLQDFCIDSICANPLPFFTSINFLSLDNNILYYLLERDYLQIDEINVWNCLIRWGIEQTPGLGFMNSDRTKWNNEDYEALNKTLDQYILLIRFMLISPFDYINKIQPYKAVIPNNICEEIEEFYIKGTLPKTITLLPRNRIESNIIKPKYISRIINWIDKKDKDFIRSYNDTLYKFDLIHKGSRDRMSNESFKNKFSLISLYEPILCLIKCQITQKMFGGYTPVGLYYYIEGINGINRSQLFYYNKYSFLADSSFIIYFDENDDMKLCRVCDMYNENAIFAIFNFYSDNFGFDFGSAYNICRFRDGFDDDHLYGMGSYTIEEIEAFKVVKR